MIPPTETKEAFGRAVKHLRGARNQQDLGYAIADHLGRTKLSKQSIISKVENGKAHVSIDEIDAIAKGLKVSPADLLLAWAEELDPDRPYGYRLRRAQVLQALDELHDVVLRATSQFLETGTAARELEPYMVTAVADLVHMGPGNARRVMRLASYFNRLTERFEAVPTTDEEER